jgi:hypothetical protein
MALLTAALFFFYISGRVFGTVCHNQFAGPYPVAIRYEYMFDVVLPSTLKIEAMWNTQHSILIVSCV